MTPEKKIITAYDYTDEDGKLLYQNIRFEPKDFRQRRPDGSGGYVWNLNGTRRVLYRLQELLRGDPKEWVYYAEGEKDVESLRKIGLTATTAGGVNSWKDEFAEFLNDRKVCILPDNDEPGLKLSQKVSDALKKVDCPKFKILQLPNLPPKGDVTDWLNNGGTKEELLKLTESDLPVEPLIDVSQFNPMTISDLSKVLGITIKSDDTNKLLVFLCQLSAYTASSQFNVSFNAPSSTGKSYIPIEISNLFPSADVQKIGYCSPTAYFHDSGIWDEKNKVIVVDLSHKIMIFLDQPHQLLLQHLRPLLSHDQPEISIKITDKSMKYGLKTKKVLLRGFPSVVFCTAGLRVDEQEGTRFLLLSPETTQEKIREAVLLRIEQGSDYRKYKEWLDSQPERKLLKDRIQAIRQASISDVTIPMDALMDRILTNDKIFRPRDTRDTGRILSIIKAIAILNCWFRPKEGNIIMANDDDIEAGFKLWESISESQTLGLPPYVCRLYQEIILPAYSDKNQHIEAIAEAVGRQGLTRQDILQKHLKTYGRLLNPDQLRKEILPMMESAGLIVQEADAQDKRKLLVYPMTANNRGKDGGVE
jgi:hypothetical protein